jgi:hypothetical protein
MYWIEIREIDWFEKLATQGGGFNVSRNCDRCYSDDGFYM